MTTLWVVLSLATAAAMIVLVLVAADGVWTFIKLTFITTLLWCLVFGLTAMIIGMFHTGGAIASCAIYALFLFGMYKLCKAIATFSRARRNPADYVVLDKHCGTCGRALMPDPFGEGYEHIYKPDAQHELIVVDGAPELLNELDVSHRLADH